MLVEMNDNHSKYVCQEVWRRAQKFLETKGEEKKG